MRPLLVVLLAIAMLAMPLIGAAAPGDVSWRSLASTFTPRLGAGSAYVGEQAYVVGGFNAGIGQNQGYLAVAERYDPATRTWLSRAPMSQQRYRLGVAALP